MTELPASVTVSGAPRMTSGDIRALKKATGRTMTELMEDDADRLQLTVFCQLRRADPEADPAVLWEAADDVVIVFEAPEADPTNAASSPS
jgi:hypothetical protein